MNRFVSIALLAVVVLAGCGGAPTQTATEQPVSGASSTAGPVGSETATPDPTPTPTPNIAFPPGLSRAGVSNTSTLLDAHDEALGTENLTVSFDFTLEVNGEGQDVFFKGKITPSNQKGWMRIVLEDGIGTYYNEAGVTYANITQNGESTYRKEYELSAMPKQTRFGADIRMRNAIDAANWEFDGLVTRNGTEFRRFVATDVSLPESVDVQSDNVSVDSSGVLLVDETGIVHHVSVHSTVETPDKTVTYGIDVTLSDIGSTTIERPDWYWDARD